jgi:hypothetical protein
VQIDTQWQGNANFTFYDFGKPEEVPEALHHQARAARRLIAPRRLSRAAALLRSSILCSATHRSSLRLC